MNKNYLQFTFHVKDENVKDILLAQLSDIGFNGFEEKENVLTGFIDSADFVAGKFNAIIKQHNIAFSKEIIEDQNWNKLWEEKFQPVIIEHAVAVRAHFHRPIKSVDHEIVITPKMSFGTGHHATTYMMLEQMSSLNFKGKSVLDYGTGTGILAVYAEKLGAAAITAIDYDDWSINNALENIEQNCCTKINLLLADKPTGENVYDRVLANINKNVITDNFAIITKSLDKNGNLLLSGLLSEDEETILQLASISDLKHVKTYHRDKWICLKFCR